MREELLTGSDLSRPGVLMRSAGDGGRTKTYLSCPSFFLLLLLLRAILALQLTFLAGPTLMEVFSSAVVCRLTLLPLC